jgi:hypothetical protein
MSGVIMRRTLQILTLILLAGLLRAALPQVDTKVIQKVFLSPNGEYKVLYMGASTHGEGTYFRINRTDTVKVIEENFRLGPDATWLTDSILAIRNATGSPNFHMYYYDATANKLSPSYNIAIAVDVQRKVVACLDMEAVIFYRLFTTDTLLVYPLKNLEPMGFLVFCRSKAKFLENSDFYITWQCPKEGGGMDLTKELTITIER